MKFEFKKGAEIIQTKNSDSSIAVGFDSFSDVDFEGTFLVKPKLMTLLALLSVIKVILASESIQSTQAICRIM